MDDGSIPPTSLKKSKAPFIVLGIGLLLAAAGVGLFFLYPGLNLPPAVPDAGPPPVAGVDAGPAVPALDLDKGNALVEESAKGVLPDAWLKGGDAIRRLAAAVNAVAEGQSPRVVLGVLQVDGEFSVNLKRPRKRSDHIRYYISAKSDERYDGVTKLITSIDAAAVGERYKTFRPYLEAAYREIARPEKTFDQAFTQAVDSLAAAPVIEGQREVEQMSEGTGYAYVNPRLEALSPAQKHLMRMGPKNQRAIVAQLQAFRAAMK